MNKNLKIVVSGDEKNYLDKNLGDIIWRTLADNGFVEGKSIRNVGFCRDLEKNILVAVLPKAYSTNEGRKVLSSASESKKHIYKLIRIFNKVWRETNLKQNLIK